MGTDIYLRWKGITPEEEDAQLCGFDIRAGGMGYLRASIRMNNEHCVLRGIFDDKYWEYDCGEEYDFRAGFRKLMELALPYLMACAGGNNLVDESWQAAARQQLEKKLHEALLEAGWSVSSTEEPSGSNRDASTKLEEGILWIASLIEFFELGMAKQTEGLAPYPMICW